MERYQFLDEPAAYFVTFSVVEWLPIFVTERTCLVITDSLDFCHQKKGLRISAYVIMPTHMHAIVFDDAWNAARLRQTLIDFRKYTGRRLADDIVAHGPPSFVKATEAAAGEDRFHRLWQPTKHPEAISTERFWQQKVDYLHENPCRKGLVRRAAEWRFSSAAYYHSDGRESCDVSLTPLRF